MPKYEVDGKSPTVDESVYVADGATLIGDVRLSANVSVWTGVVIRGDNDSVSVGEATNIQENTVIHADPGYPVTIGDRVTIGHQAMIHGCTLEEGVLVGIQAIVLNGAVIGKNSLVGAGAVVTENKVFPENSLILGSPAKVVREIKPEMLAKMQADNADYVARAKRYKETIRRID